MVQDVSEYSLITLMAQLEYTIRWYDFREEGFGLPDTSNREPMLDMYIFETLQQVEQLEQAVLDSEKLEQFDAAAINSIFRIMHTIKSSAAMMLFSNVSSLAHVLEDLFYYIREKQPNNIDHSRLTDIVLSGIDFFKTETVKIDRDQAADGDPAVLIEEISAYLSQLKADNTLPSAETPLEASLPSAKRQNYYISAEKVPANPGRKSYHAVVFFEDGCEMENIRAFTIIHNLKAIADDVTYEPADIIENNESAKVIKENGFSIWFSADASPDAVQKLLESTAFLKSFEINEQAAEPSPGPRKPLQIILEDPMPELPERYLATKGDVEKHPEREAGSTSLKQTMISVNVAKLDKLMDIVGELVIAEAMVTQNPDLAGLKLDNFSKAARQFQKITNELQDVVMSIRMMPLTVTFQKMNRIVRDTCKKLGKEVELTILGQETEVDKNIIEQISDPLMHLIRNAIDHGLEPPAERQQQGKSAVGSIVLEAKNAGNDVWIIVRDDGRGLDREKILAKAKANGLLTRPEQELTDKDIYSFIFLPGFSTKDNVTELSGRGVGMDVVTQNVEKIGGAILVDSTPGQGTAISIKIPLTLAIIDGMTVKVGQSRYTIPTTAIRESFRAKPSDIITDPEGQEMILIRGKCLPIVRLHERYHVQTPVTQIPEGIVVILENDFRSICVFADELLGQQQVVVKALPGYIKKVRGLAGCTLLGDGSISLILDVSELFKS